MRQAHFIERHVREWDEFAQWLDARAASPRTARGTRGWSGLADADMPARFRRLCHQLALARRRGYSPIVTTRLQDLMQRGHNALYRPAPPRWKRAFEFVLADFPRLVRAQRGCLWLSFALFVGATVGMYAAVQWKPELIHSVYEPAQIAQFERMYDPASDGAKLGRDSGSDLQMFGYYIANNIGIGFRTFASGLLFGAGTVFVLVLNGLMIGGVASHLQLIGHGDPFWRFVVGHGSFELTAIVIAGAGGLRLGLALVAPAGRRRIDALIDAGRAGGLLCLGIFAMLLMAAFIEAFWSSIGWMPAVIKFSVGGVLWALVIAWLVRGGRGSLARAALPRRLPSDPPGMAGPDHPEPAMQLQGRQQESSVRNASPRDPPRDGQRMAGPESPEQTPRRQGRQQASGVRDASLRVANTAPFSDASAAT